MCWDERGGSRRRKLQELDIEWVADELQEALGWGKVNYLDESEVLTPAGESHYIWIP